MRIQLCILVIPFSHVRAYDLVAYVVPVYSAGPVPICSSAEVIICCRTPSAAAALRLAESCLVSALGGLEIEVASVSVARPDKNYPGIQLVNLCFCYGLVPSQWHMSLVESSEPASAGPGCLDPLVIMHCCESSPAAPPCSSSDVGIVVDRLLSDLVVPMALHDPGCDDAIPLFDGLKFCDSRLLSDCDDCAVHPSL